ncbi:MAG: hypothetical protein HYU25_16945 [Candidatus Rokubacteria bacterium]|nr:hypothetical protein [Candidatus Rokubacteria bacterium]
MKTFLYHVQLNVSDPQRSIPFYPAPGHTSPPFHRKRTGLNHLAFGAESREAVDTFHREFLVARGIPALYGPPREYPEYAAGQMLVLLVA